MNRAKEAESIIHKFVKRSMWMNNLQSDEFRMYFLEMVTEIRRLSGRDFNADFTLEDVKRTVLYITETYPLTGKVSVNTVFQALDSLQSLGKLSDLQMIAIAVSSYMMSAGLAFIGTGAYLFLRIFGYDRLKCVTAMGIGGALALELYGVRDEAIEATVPLHRQRQTNVFGIASVLVGVVGLITAIVIPADFIVKAIFSAIGVVGVAGFIGAMVFNARNSEWKAAAVETDARKSFSFRKSYYDDALTQFRFDTEEMRFLHSLEFMLTQDNIEKTADSLYLGSKRIWADKWKSMTERRFGYELMTDREELWNTVDVPAQQLPKVKKGILFVECALFRPFYPMEKSDRTDIPMRERSNSDATLNELSKRLSINISAKDTIAKYRQAMRDFEMRGIFEKVVKDLFQVGFKLPIVYKNSMENEQVITATMTVAGSKAEATENVYVAGGGVCCREEYLPILKEYAQHDAAMPMNQLAKLDAVMRLILVSNPCGEQYVRSILSEQASIRNELIRAYNAMPTDKDELKKAIHYFEVAIRKTEDILKNDRNLIGSK